MIDVHISTIFSYRVAIVTLISQVFRQSISCFRIPLPDVLKEKISHFVIFFCLVLLHREHVQEYNKHSHTHRKRVRSFATNLVQIVESKLSRIATQERHRLVGLVRCTSVVSRPRVSRGPGLSRTVRDYST